MRVLALTVLGLCLWAPAVVAPAATSPPSVASDPDRAPCTRWFQRGAFHQAVDCWQAVAQRFKNAKQPVAQREALLHLSQAYQALGLDRKAVDSLHVALALAQAERPQNPVTMAVLQDRLGNAYIATGPPETAAQHLRQALDLARTLDKPGLVAIVLTNLGNWFLSQGRFHDALASYNDSAVQAKAAGHHVTAARAFSNAAKAAVQVGDYPAAKGLLEASWEQMQAVTPSHDTAYGLISLGVTAQRLRPHLRPARPALLDLAFQALQAATRMAQTLQDPRAASYAWGYLGRLYETQHRYEEALRLTHRATFAAQQVHVPEALYQWQWQTGRLHVAQGQIDRAIAAYSRAVETLQAMRVELPHRYGEPPLAFRQSLGPVYFDLVDLLLQRAGSIPEDDAQHAAHLQRARETVERFKAAELRNYFQSDCVEASQARVTPLDVLAQQAVIIYPISLPDRLELLVNLPTGLTRVAVPVPAETMNQTVRRFRRKLQHRARRFRRDAQELYDWLVRPLEPLLQSLPTHTLVFVPDGALRTIPLAALHDGQQFLTQKYALAITPGLDLMDPRPMPQRQPQVLAGGLTQAAHGQPPLPHVEAELRAVLRLYEGTLLLNEDFHLTRLEQEAAGRPFRIVHLASHGHFAPDVAQSFLVTASERLSMAHLEALVRRFRFRDEPLELLTLSACETALGDDRAALGLAGVGIQAGARSVLATLWRVQDQAAARLVEAFYQQLRNPAVSRAVALQRAQLTLLKEGTRHPFFWAPFVLINTWL